jgi:hypothetical protein
VPNRFVITPKILRRVLLLVLLTASVPGNADTGPVGWCKFHEGSGSTTEDASTYSNTGTLVNSPTWAAGRVGPGSLTFNGSTSYVNVPNASGSLDNLRLLLRPHSRRGNALPGNGAMT